MKNRPIQEIYSDKHGNKYYGFKDERLLPPLRAQAALVFTRFAELRLTWARLDRILSEIERLHNAGQFMKAGALVEEIRISESLFAEPQTLEDLATVYVILPDEPLYEFEAEWVHKKKELWSEDAQARAFFLTMAYRKTALYSANSGLNLTEYFKEVAEVIKRFSHFEPVRGKSRYSEALTSFMK